MDKSMESVMWQIIEDMNFNERGHKEAGLYLINESGLKFGAVKKVESFARRKCAALYDQLFDVKGVSDDSYDDLRWQIVANGEEFYNNITLEKAQSMIDNNEFTESFAYAFHAVDDIVDEQQSANLFLKKERALKHIEQIRKTGGGFHQKLVAAFEHADNNNKRKLALGFPELFEHLVD
jgi:hypothetical protein